MYDCIIIGGGVSGLKAAQTLSSHSILLLEAQDRLGGRILTDRTSSPFGAHYDLGASWFHDALSNCVLSELLRDPQFDFHRDCAFYDQDPLVYASHGRIDTWRSKINKVVEEMETYIELHFFDSLSEPDISLKELVERYIDEKGYMMTPEQRQYAPQIMRQIELWFGLSWDTISGKYAVMSHQGRNIYNTRGYDYLVDKLAAQIDPESVRLRQQVVRIERGRTVKVTTRDGSVFEGRYAVVSVPQSVLSLPKEHPYGIEWVPALPESVEKAIQTVHYSALGKVIFEFDKRWWDDNETFLVLGTKEEEMKENEKEEKEKEDEMDEIRGYSSHSHTDAIPNFPSFSFPAYVVSLPGKNHASLLVLTQSPLTEYLEANPDKAWAYFRPMLSKIAVSDVCDPVNTITSNWTLNPYIRGSYTALHPGDDPSDLIVQLSAEIDACPLAHSIVRFAGEHTISEGAGCVSGAYESGERAGKYVRERIKFEQ